MSATALISEIVAAFNCYGLNTKIIAASIAASLILPREPGPTMQQYSILLAAAPISDRPGIERFYGIGRIEIKFGPAYPALLQIILGGGNKYVIYINVTYQGLMDRTGIGAGPGNRGCRMTSARWMGWAIRKGRRGRS